MMRVQSLACSVNPKNPMINKTNQFQQIILLDYLLACSFPAATSSFFWPTAFSVGLPVNSLYGPLSQAKEKLL
jgi:hypothetical protein